MNTLVDSRTRALDMQSFLTHSFLLLQAKEILGCSFSVLRLVYLSRRPYEAAFMIPPMLVLCGTCGPHPFTENIPDPSNRQTLQMQVAMQPPLLSLTTEGQTSPFLLLDIPTWDLDISSLHPSDHRKHLYMQLS